MSFTIGLLAMIASFILEFTPFEDAARPWLQRRFPKFRGWMWHLLIAILFTIGAATAVIEHRSGEKEIAQIRSGIRHVAADVEINVTEWPEGVEIKAHGGSPWPGELAVIALFEKEFVMEAVQTDPKHLRLFRANQTLTTKGTTAQISYRAETRSDSNFLGREIDFLERAKGIAVRGIFFPSIAIAGKPVNPMHVISVKVRFTVNGGDRVYQVQRAYTPPRDMELGGTLLFGLGDNEMSPLANP